MVLTHIDLKYVSLIYSKIRQKVPNGKGLNNHSLTPWSGSKRHSFSKVLNIPVQAPIRGQPFDAYSLETAIFQSPFTTRMGVRRSYCHKHPGSPRWVITVIESEINDTCNDISVIYVTVHRCAGWPKKKLNLRFGHQRHKHFVGFFSVPVQAPTRPIYIRLFREYDTLGIRIIH